jgi:hypothetical protein
MKKLALFFVSIAVSTFLLTSNFGVASDSWRYPLWEKYMECDGGLVIDRAQLSYYDTYQLVIHNPEAIQILKNTNDALKNMGMIQRNGSELVVREQERVTWDDAVFKAFSSDQQRLVVAKKEGSSILVEIYSAYILLSDEGLLESSSIHKLAEYRFHGCR